MGSQNPVTSINPAPSIQVILGEPNVSLLFLLLLIIIIIIIFITYFGIKFFFFSCVN